ncbi:hypothetical protein [Gloeocapsa sp. PCC 73106]|uniref:hypothetical protein n=1 Tax=Gloeocapsa sp. PCC 73106 TaxID=102232 RepID=UPI0002ACF5F2|nr:hypothetical protein [Gloeocapsa sp. PCC 73106]ELR98681.1 hypothetical protein GLO73106DRAFT_00025190 [Gloeocapsa sp. PCC 73106]
MLKSYWEGGLQARTDSHYEIIIAQQLKFVKMKHPESTWRLAWGRTDHLSGATWQEDGIALFTPTFAFSPSQRYVVTLEAYLTGYLGSLELIAQSWDDLGEETLKELVGMFSLAVWDRESRKLYLGRDRSGCYTLYYTTQGSTRWASSCLKDLKPYHSAEIYLKYHAFRLLVAKEL